MKYTIKSFDIKNLNNPRFVFENCMCDFKDNILKIWKGKDYYADPGFILVNCETPTFGNSTGSHLEIGITGFHLLGDEIFEKMHLTIAIKPD